MPRPAVIPAWMVGPVRDQEFSLHGGRSFLIRERWSRPVDRVSALCDYFRSWREQRARQARPGRSCRRRGSEQLSKLGYDKYIEFVWHSLAAVFLVCCACVGISAATS